MPARIGGRRVLGGGSGLLSNYLSALVLAETTGAVYWPLDDTGAFSRAINPALALGRNIVINGTFAADTDWTKGTGWTIGSGVATAAAAATGQLLSQAITGLVIGKSYEVVFTVSGYVSGSVRPQVGSSGTGTTRSADGTYTETIVCAGSTTFAFNQPTAFTGNIDNVTVKQVNILASSAFPSAELMIDGNMNAADASAYTAVNSATLSKVAGYLRVARNGVNNPGAQQTVLTIGKTYRVVLTTRSDGNATPTVLHGTTTAFTGTTSTSDQAVDIQFVASATTLICRATTSTGTQYVEFDNISVTEVNPLTGVISGALVNQVLGGAVGVGYSFDGVNDYDNVYSGELNSVFNPSVGTLIAFVKITDAAVWTDATVRRFAILGADASNFVLIERTATNNTLRLFYAAGGTSKSVSTTTYGGRTDLLMLAMTWDKPGDLLTAYGQGVSLGTATALGTWVGNLAATQAVLGAANTSGTNPHKGLLAHCVLVGRALSGAEIQTIAQRAGVAA